MAAGSHKTWSESGWESRTCVDCDKKITHKDGGEFHGPFDRNGRVVGAWSRCSDCRWAMRRQA